MTLREPPPDFLYPYRVYCKNAIFEAYSLQKDIDAFCDEIEDRKKSNERMILWGKDRNNIFHNLRIFSGEITGVDDAFGINPITHGREQRKKEVKG